MTTTHTQPAGCDLDSLRALIANDGFAMSFQSMGQYRTALIAAARAAQAPQGDTRQGAPAWGSVETVGDMVRNLLTLDQAAPIYAAFHVDIAGERRCRTKPVTISRERVIDGKWVDSRRKDVPYAMIVWAKPDEAAHTCTPADERALKALAAITERVALTYRICCGTAPKQSVGELLDVTIKMPEWEIVRAALQARAAQGAGTAPTLAPCEGGPILPDSCSDCRREGGLCELVTHHPAPVSTAPVWADLRKLDLIDYSKGVICTNNTAYVALRTHIAAALRDANPTAPVSTAAATTASASMPVLNNGTREQQLEAVARGGIDDLMRLHAALGFGEDETIDADKMIERIATLAPSRAADGQQGASSAVLSDEQIDQIARAYFSEEWAQKHAKDAIHDAFAALARAPLPAQADGQAVDDARVQLEAAKVERENRVARQSAPEGAPVGMEAVAWLEAEASARGRTARQVLNSFVYSTRMHTKAAPVTSNPVWALYAPTSTSPQPATDKQHMSHAEMLALCEQKPELVSGLPLAGSAQPVDQNKMENNDE